MLPLPDQSAHESCIIAAAGGGAVFSDGLFVKIARLFLTEVGKFYENPFQLVVEDRLYFVRRRFGHRAGRDLEIPLHGGHERRGGVFPAVSDIYRAGCPAGAAGRVLHRPQERQKRDRFVQSPLAEQGVAVGGAAGGVRLLCAAVVLQRGGRLGAQLRGARLYRPNPYGRGF